VTYLKDQSGTLRQLLNFDEDTDVAPQGVSRKLQLSTVRIEGEVNDIHITTEKVKKVFAYCKTCECATRRHIVFDILWQTGMRSGVLKGLNTDDFDQEGQTLSFSHRPESGTSLKNKERGARYVHIDTELTEVITDSLNIICIINSLRTTMRGCH
jgi:integrase